MGIPRAILSDQDRELCNASMIILTNLVLNIDRLVHIHQEQTDRQKEQTKHSSVNLKGFVIIFSKLSNDKFRVMLVEMELSIAPLHFELMTKYASTIQENRRDKDIRVIFFLNFIDVYG